MIPIGSSRGDVAKTVPFLAIYQALPDRSIEPCGFEAMSHGFHHSPCNLMPNLEINKSHMWKSRTMSLTKELVDMCFRPEPQAAIPEGSVALTDQDFEIIAEKVDREAGSDPFWVFAYGSLIWKPAFDAVESRRATAFGWHRTFSLIMHRFRGSPEVPGLMMALSRGGRCDGVIYRMAEQERRASIVALLRREMDDEFGASTMRWLPVKTTDGTTRALGCWVGARGPLMAEGQPLEVVADILARACGHVGSNAEYLFNTVSHLETVGIHDRNLWRLQSLVANRIRELHGMPAIS